jgi:hypothetical protein
LNVLIIIDHIIVSSEVEEKKTDGIFSFL